MKKLFIALILVSSLSYVSYAQKGKNEVGLGLNVGFPVGNFGDSYKAGFGGYVKGLLGVGTSGQATLTTGYNSYKGKGGLYSDYSFSILPILAGYRHHLSNFYLEPQLGLGIYKTKAKSESYSATFSETKFTYAIGAGYTIKGFDVGANYQSGAMLGQILAHLGFNIPIGSKR
ncbi:MAG: hypothetical protein ICV51_00835 [Flavisolibacter sp.]|nr:hypothetical protein [Flavisolibacter sp.]